MGTSHRILNQRLWGAQQKQMHGASTIPIIKKPPKGGSFKKITERNKLLPLFEKVHLKREGYVSILLL